MLEVVLKKRYYLDAYENTRFGNYNVNCISVQFFKEKTVKLLSNFRRFQRNSTLIRSRFFLITDFYSYLIKIDEKN